MNHDNDNPISNRSDTLFRAAVILLGATAVVVIFHLFLLFQLGGWQVFTMMGVICAFGVATLVSIVLIRRGQPDLGLNIIIVGLMIVFPVASLLVVGAGLVLGIALVLITLTLVVQVLSQERAGRVAIASIAVGIVTLLLDMYGGDYRLTVPILRTFLPAISGVLILVYGVFIARQFRNYTLRVKLITAVVGVTAIAVVVVAGITFGAMQSALENQIGESYLIKTESMAQFIISFFKDKVTQIVSLTMADTIKTELAARNQSYTGSPDAILAEIQALDAQWVAAGDDDALINSIITPDPAVNPTAYQLMDFLETFSDQSEIFITDRYGATVGATNRLSDYYQADEEWWQAAWNDGQGAIYISNPEYDESAGVTASLIAAPVFDKETGDVLGIARSTLVLDKLFAVVGTMRYGETGHVMLLDDTATVLYESIMEGDEGRGELDLGLREHLVGEKHIMIENDVDGEPAIFAHLPIATVADYGETDVGEIEWKITMAVIDLGWTVVIHQKVAEAFAPIARFSHNIQLVGVATLIAAGLGAWGIARVLTGPILALADASDAMGAGNLDVALPPAGRDEIGRLTTSFGNMTGRLKQTLLDLEQQNAHLHTMVGRYVDHMTQVVRGNLAVRIALDDVPDEENGERDAPLVSLGHSLNEMTISLQSRIEHERLQHETIQAQQQALSELSTPVFPVMDRIIVLPLVGNIDDARARDVMRTLLVGIQEHRAKVVILDVTGVSIVDSEVANYLNKTIHAARLKGAHTILTGIANAVAETIVDLGIDWEGVDTVNDLQTGLQVALERMGRHLA